MHRTLENPEKTGSPSFLKSKRTWVKGGCSARFRTKCGVGWPTHSEFTFDRASAERSAEQGVVSETIAAALYLISENRKANEVVVKLKPSAVELVAKRRPALA